MTDIENYAPWPLGLISWWRARQANQATCCCSASRASLCRCEMAVMLHQGGWNSSPGYNVVSARRVSSKEHGGASGQEHSAPGEGYSGLGTRGGEEFQGKLPTSTPPTSRQARPEGEQKPNAHSGQEPEQKLEERCERWHRGQSRQASEVRRREGPAVGADHTSLNGEIQGVQRTNAKERWRESRQVEEQGQQGPPKRR